MTWVDRGPGTSAILAQQKEVILSGHESYYRSEIQPHSCFDVARIVSAIRFAEERRSHHAAITWILWCVEGIPEIDQERHIWTEAAD